MARIRGGYYSKLAQHDLSLSSLESIQSLMQERLHLVEIDQHLLRGSRDLKPLPARLKHLMLKLAKGPRSWNGLVVGFPGTSHDLSTSYVGTPFLRQILYPILELRRRAMNHYQVYLPCLYLLGERFSDVFLRKFRFLSQAVQHLIILTKDIINLNTSIHPVDGEDHISESYVRDVLCNRMMEDGFLVQTATGNLDLVFIAKELPTAEGTRNPERLDILAADKHGGSLVAFELKGPKASKIEVNNLFFQGLEHRDWLESNKMAIKFVFEGPRGRIINTRKRVKLVLGFFGEYIPPLFSEFRTRAVAKDPYLNIYFLRLEEEKSK